MVALVLSLAVLIGLTLGMLGGGGAILTVPLLSYVGGLETQVAITSSLVVIALTSAVAVWAHARAGRVRWRIGVVLGPAAMLGATVAGQAAGWIPGRVLMLAFAAMMIATGLAMLRPRPRAPRGALDELRPRRAFALGLGIGSVAGLVGAGGGFLMVPALTMRGRLPMESAVATSLLVISLQSTAGAASHLVHVDIPWPLALGVAGIAIVGTVLGAALVPRVAATTLRRGFGVFVLLMAAIVLVRELLT